MSKIKKKYLESGLRLATTAISGDHSPNPLWLGFTVELGLGDQVRSKVFVHQAKFCTLENEINFTKNTVCDEHLSYDRNRVIIILVLL